MKQQRLVLAARSLAVLVLVGLLIAWSTPPVGSADYTKEKLRFKLESIETRTGITLPFLVLGDPQDVSKTALIILPGGWGDHQFRIQEDGSLKLGINFLVRTAPMFAEKGYRVVIVDVPSDKQSGMDDDFRKSDSHAQDIRGLIKEIASHGVESFFLLGTSRSTLSICSLAAKLKDARIKGIVLTSSLDYDDFLKWLPLENIRYPVLLVHHRNDECKICSFYQAMKLRDALRKTIKVDFVEVSGGRFPDTGPCQPLSPHGYYGKEDKVVEAITLWLSGNKVSEMVE